MSSGDCRIIRYYNPKARIALDSDTGFSLTLWPQPSLSRYLPVAASQAKWRRSLVVPEKMSLSSCPAASKANTPYLHHAQAKEGDDVWVAAKQVDYKQPKLLNQSMRTRSREQERVKWLSLIIFIKHCLR